MFKASMIKRSQRKSQSQIQRNSDSHSEIWQTGGGCWGKVFTFFARAWIRNFEPNMGFETILGHLPFRMMTFASSGRSWIGWSELSFRASWLALLRSPGEEVLLGRPIHWQRSVGIASITRLKGLPLPSLLGFPSFSLVFSLFLFGFLLKRWSLWELSFPAPFDHLTRAILSSNQLPSRLGLLGMDSWRFSSCQFPLTHARNGELSQ